MARYRLQNIVLYDINDVIVSLECSLKLLTDFIQYINVKYIQFIR